MNDPFAYPGLEEDTNELLPEQFFNVTADKSIWNQMVIQIYILDQQRLNNDPDIDLIQKVNFMFADYTPIFALGLAGIFEHRAFTINDVPATDLDGVREIWKNAKERIVLHMIVPDPAVPGGFIVKYTTVK